MNGKICYNLCQLEACFNKKKTLREPLTRNFVHCKISVLPSCSHVVRTHVRLKYHVYTSIIDPFY